MRSYHVQRGDGELNAPCRQGFRRKSRRGSSKSHNQRQNTRNACQRQRRKPDSPSDLRFPQMRQKQNGKNFSEADQKAPAGSADYHGRKQYCRNSQEGIRFLGFAEREEQSNGENRFDEGRKVGVIDNRAHYKI